MTVAPIKKEVFNIETWFVSIGNYKIYNLFTFIDSIILPGSKRRTCKGCFSTFHNPCDYRNRVLNHNGIDFGVYDLISGR